MRLERLPTGAVLAALGPGHHPEAALRPVVAGSEASGPAVTCRCPAGDNLAVVRALDACSAGDVLLVQTDPTVEVALFGGLLATFAAERRLAAVVLDGWIRDVAEIRARGLPVWSRGVRLAGPTREREGELGVPLTLGTLVVHPGDFIWADDDGVVAVPAARLVEVVEKARAKEALEQRLAARIRSGEPLADVLGLARDYG